MASTIRAAALAIMLVGCGSPQFDRVERDLVPPQAPGHPVRWEKDLGRAVNLSPVPYKDGWIIPLVNNSIQFLRGDTGEVLWKKKLSSPPFDATLVGAGLLVVATDLPKEDLRALSPEDGSTVWNVEREGGHLATNATDLVVIRRNGVVSRRDLSSGAALWEQNLRGAGWRGAHLLQASVLIPVRPDSLVALDLETGKRLWAREVGDWPHVTGSDPVVTFSDQGLLTLMDAQTGKTIRERELEGIPTGPPQVDQNHVLLSLTKGTVTMLKLSDLSPHWEQTLDAPLVSPPAVHGDLVLQSGAKGGVTVMDWRTGKTETELWHREKLFVSPVSSKAGILVAGSHGRLICYGSHR
ncbi:MAG: PQQ-binding-like beta-propeller repeat protein [Candidatus Eisenbacteria bacterium]|uniref:PQQ-binding-like beta-propeller repeat protein n=1 Tax=Eiseniibacteriota bacterium TaxID=2212470 RepID=A0A7Y2H1W4_UNCEI|nr:PQQ-binding-like beta-propeller repeat protein [Candidatus Eisenbacteria bacterium]